MATFRSFILLGLMPALFSACSGKTNPNEEALRYLNESLEYSRANINKSTETLLWDLSEKLKDPSTSYRANRWQPRAALINELTRNVLSEIEFIKGKLLKISNPNKSLEQVKDIGSDIKKLGEKLINYNRDLMAIDSQLTQVFANPIKLASADTSTAISLPIYLFSGKITVRLGICLLNQFETNIKIFENRMVQFANNKVGNIDYGFEFYSAIIAIDAMVTEPGTRLEITARVGAFSKKAKPVITVDGKLLPLAEDGASHYTFSAPGATGKYKKRLKIEFIDEIGKMQIMEKDIKYTVVP